MPVENIKNIKSYVRKRIKAMMQYAEDKGFGQYIKHKSK